MVINTSEKLRRRVIKNFMDILILTELKKQSMSGYDVMGLIHKKFDVLVSSGTIYSLLYSMEREGLIKGVLDQRTRVYELTEKGKRDIETVTKANEEIQAFLRNISLLNANRQSSMSM